MPVTACADSRLLDYRHKSRVADLSDQMPVSLDACLLPYSPSDLIADCESKLVLLMVSEADSS